MMPKKSMVLAAGFGTRMRPLTDTMPKPLVPVAGRSLIDRTLDWLAASGVEEAVVNTHYKAGMLAAHLASRKRPVIHVSHEEEILETGGGLVKALPLLGQGPFFSTNSDMLCLDGATPVLHRLWQAWDDDKWDALLLLHPVAEAIGYEGPGDFFMENGNLHRRGAHDKAPFVFTGMQILHPRLFASAPAGAFSLNVLYNRATDKDGKLTRIGGLLHDAAWLHIGDPKGLAAAEAFLSHI
jgi:MurNAc alpha-1-phosphate uridylyltransferase